MLESICDACRAIDFEKVLKVPASEFTVHREVRNPYDTYPDLLLDKDIDRLSQLQDTDCSLCKILASTLCSTEDEWSDPGIVEDALLSPHKLKAFSFLRNCAWTSEDVQGAQDCYMLLAPRSSTYSSGGGYSKWAWRGEAGYVACLPKKREAGLFVPQIISESFDSIKARSWLRHCKRSHGAACNEYSKTIPGLEVIDCETLRIVPAEAGMQWVALSYVWGPHQSQVNHGDTEPGSLPSDLPRTIRDTIEVTKALGYRYLWIDRYCINQEDAAKKHDLISKMDIKYRGADLTIAAAAGHDENFGLPGVGNTTRKKQAIVELNSCTILSTGPDPASETENSRWRSRGWTFQEGLLSRRRLIFTEHQSWFECCEGGWMEALGGPELLNNPDEARCTSGKIGRSLDGRLLSYHLTSTPLMADPNDRVIASRLDQFAHIVGKYSQRDLTFDTDSLNAFAGVSRHLRDSHPQLSHIFGIPYMVPSNAPLALGSAEKYMFYFLSWIHNRGAPPRKRLDFPSWTWAGWAGGMGWMTGRLDGVTALEQKMRNIHFEVDDHLVLPEAYFDTFDSISCQIPESDVILCFEAQVVPPSLFSWDTYEERREISPSYDSIDGQSQKDEEIPDGENQSDNDIPDEEDQGDNDPSEGESEMSSESPPPDPNDWDTWAVGNNRLWDRAQPPDCDPATFIDNLEKGRWDCLLLGDYNGNAGYSHRRFMLVIEWLDDGLAHRVGSVVLNRQHYLDRGNIFFDDTELAWKSVRLI
ncbi:uncharacterized protein N0V89_006153 [Didymosphaeria variabile]|uniref:Heterokaryon incompatibility domain-containing protein n=1 Tax=Didymosphaeria variabile TaxID=1932322 RepID=A0A9W8XM16_9PLEO|nr:uncharacterized protein N0V89_006153 [Didymosphaeria variabile]KAJ4354417.1 hypothetical protein N0V89_006153 [Didymosphaeria variabile]